MVPLGLSINRVARDLRVPVTRMSEIVNGRRSVTADTALRLARYFAMTPQFWMNLQAAYDPTSPRAHWQTASNGTSIRARPPRSSGALVAGQAHLQCSSCGAHRSCSSV